VNLRPRSFKVLETTKLLTVLENFQSEPDAIESFFVDREDDEVNPIFT
jgi:hypothetical protein